VLTLIILWIYYQFGLISALIVLITTVYSQWITVFGRNLWWVTWSFYLPIITSIYILHYEDKRGKYSNKFSVILIFVAVFIKCLYSGYEYITTTLLMMLVPYIYYAIYKEWTIKEFIKRNFIVGITSIISVLTSMLILVYQISFVSGSFKKGIEHIEFAFLKRTYGGLSQLPPGIYKDTLKADMYTASLEADIYTVLAQYIRGVAFDFNNLFNTSSGFYKVEFYSLIFLFIVFTILVFISNEYSKTISNNRKKLISLACATWFSILAPLSWFVIFKAHSFIHTGMNHITWHMPFTIFGFALCGLVGQYLAIDIYSFLSKRVFSGFQKIKHLSKHSGGWADARR
jgi:hypothetical protein